MDTRTDASPEKQSTFHCPHEDQENQCPFLTFSYEKIEEIFAKKINEETNMEKLLKWGQTTLLVHDLEEISHDEILLEIRKIGIEKKTLESEALTSSKIIAHCKKRISMLDKRVQELLNGSK